MWEQNALSVSVVYPWDCVGDWELWLAATAQHPERVLFHMSLAWEKTKIQSMVSIECVFLRTIIKLKNPKSGTVCISYHVLKEHVPMDCYKINHIFHKVL